MVEEEIKKAKKEYNSSDRWFYEILINKSNQKYRFIRRQGSTYYVAQRELSVSGDSKYGVLCCFDLYFYNLKTKKMIWRKEGFATQRVEKVLIALDKKEISIKYMENILQQKVKKVLNFNGDIVKQPDVNREIFKHISEGSSVSMAPIVIYYIQNDIKKTKLILRDRLKLKGALKPNKINLFVESFAIQYYKKLGYQVQYYSQGIGSDIGHYTYSTKSYKEILDYFRFYRNQDKFFKKIYNTFVLLSDRIKIKNMDKFLTINRLDGKPDLLVYNDKDLFFVEVKSHIDKLMENQKLFITGLKLFNLARVELLYVYPKELRNKRIKDAEWRLKDII